MNAIGEIFLAENSQIISAEILAANLQDLERTFPELVFWEGYWDLSLEFVLRGKSENTLLCLLKFSRNGVDILAPFPDSLSSDLFFVGSDVLPLRFADSEFIKDAIAIGVNNESSCLTMAQLLELEVLANSFGVPVSGQRQIAQFLSGSGLIGDTRRANLNVEPYPYQARGIDWLVTNQKMGRLGLLLCDVMGLGKTLQAIGLLSTNVLEGKSQNLVICPGTLVENWNREIARFAPHLKKTAHFGAWRAGTVRRLTGFDIVITSYDVLLHDRALLESIQWNIVVLDEAQSIKNPNAIRTQRAKNLPRKFGLAISGTPLENRLLDLWSLTDFADPTVFGSRQTFDRMFGDDVESAIAIREKVKPVMLRRNLDEIEHQLPEKTVIEHPLIWPETLVDVYENVRLNAFEEFAAAGGFVAILRLRQLTTHPLLLDIGPSDPTVLSPKYKLVTEILKELFDNGEKALIFCSFTAMTDLFLEDFSNRFDDVLIGALDGRVKMEDRAGLVDLFNAHEGPGVLVCNPTVAGAGLNITGANHVIHYNLEWNPAKEDQATFRVFRNGQLRKTFIHRLAYAETIDQVIDERLNRKRTLSDLSVDGVKERDDLLAGLRISPRGQVEDDN